MESLNRQLKTEAATTNSSTSLRDWNRKQEDSRMGHEAVAKRHKQVKARFRFTLFSELPGQTLLFQWETLTCRVCCHMKRSKTKANKSVKIFKLDDRIESLNRGNKFCRNKHMEIIFHWGIYL